MGETRVGNAGDYVDLDILVVFCQVSPALLSDNFSVYSFIARCRKTGVYPEERTNLVHIPAARPFLHNTFIVYQNYLARINLFYNLEFVVRKSTCLTRNRPCVLSLADYKRCISKFVSCCIYSVFIEQQE